MAATLWDKFQAAVQWTNAALTRAGVVTIPGAESANFDDVGAETDTAKPTLVTDGTDVEGFASVDLGFRFSTAAESVEFLIYLWDGTNWYGGEANKTVTALAGENNVFTDPFDVESFDRIYIRIITAPTVGTLRIAASPRNA